MQTFLQSAFLQALGYAIANSLWQVALLWLIVVVINNIGRFSSSKKYFIGVIAEFAAFIWFLCTLQFYYSRCKEALSEISSAAPISSNQAYVLEPTVNNFSSAVLYVTVKGEQLLPYLSIAYLCMLFFLVIRLSRTFYLTQQIRKDGLQKPDIELRLFVKRTAAYLGIKKEVKLYFSNLIKSPLTLGFLKPLILVPVASINHLTTDQLEALLLHELAHIKRADYLINILQSVIQTLLFFNPFVLLLGQLTKKERENSCDDWVLQFQYNPVMYAEALLRIACIPAKCFAMNATGNKNDLLSRVKRMLNQQEKSYSYRNQVFAFMLITIMLSCAAWFNPGVKYNITVNKASEKHKIVLEPLSASVDNPLFNPIYFLSKPIQKELDKAMNTANDKVEEIATPVMEKTASNVLTRVAPIALEKLQNFKIDIDTKVDAALMQAKNAYKAIDQLKSTTPSLVIDTTNFVSAIKDVVINEINKTNWQQIGTDIKKVQADLLTMDQDKSWALVSSKQIADAVLQLKGLDRNNFAILKNSLQDINDKTRQKIERSAKKPEEKIKVEKQKCGTLNTYSDIQDENAVSNQNMEDYYNLASQNSEIYAPVQFNNLTYNYNISDSINKQPQSAIIVVKHNSENDSSHIKNITVEIIGDNGEKKTYEFTVEVYQ
ncbi:MAG TPA: M56 family metallopeptidase [Chitinophagaceae bacterium]|jgi:beta-lactamase regulating signal transducer with metallopeptidase domain